MRIIIILLLITISISSCDNKNSLKEKIKGVWIFGDKKGANRPDSEGLRFTTLYDFKDNGKVYFKNYGYGDTTYNWKITKDSIITIDTLKYKVKSVDDKSLVLIEKRGVNYSFITYIRPENITINKSKEEIEKILLSDTWTTLDPINKKWQSNIEFFDNHIMTYRFKLFDRNFKDTMTNITIDTWVIDKYKNYTFFVNYVRYLINGDKRQIKQIVQIDQNSFILLDKIRENKKEKFITKKQTDKREHLSKLLKGNWVSNNSKSKNYGLLVSKNMIKYGRQALYEGKINLKVENEKMYFKVDTFPPIEYKWNLGREGKTLLLEYKIKEPKIGGFMAKYADIEELNENEFRIRLFDNNFYTGKEKPNIYLLNLIQEFKKEK